jgi:2-polyprenyl-3-methyl-5-hydroxy-6-metoxy-1,4-benzoquinol methylase
MIGGSMAVSIQMCPTPKITDKSDIFVELESIYKEMGMGDNLLSHSDGRIFEYPWAIRMIGELKPDLRVLDAGCGSSPLPIYLKRKGITDITAVDAQGAFDNPTWSFKPEWKEQFGINYVRGNIIDYRSKVFDVVLCISVLEHIFRPIDALKVIVNLWENVRDGGKLIMTFDYRQWIALGMQLMLGEVANLQECIEYDGKISAICLNKLKENDKEWLQQNAGK